MMTKRMTTKASRSREHAPMKRGARMVGGLLVAGLAAGCAATTGYQMDSRSSAGDAAVTAVQTGNRQASAAQAVARSAETGRVVGVQTPTGGGQGAGASTDASMRGMKVALLQLAAADGGTATDAAATIGDAGSAAAGAATDAAGSAASAVTDVLPGTDLSDNLPTAGLKAEHLTTYDPKDPLQAYNRFMHGFNDKADRYVLKPVAKAYDFVTPQAVQLVVRNFFSNLGDVWNSVNNLLQWKPKEALNDATRFVLNSSLGMFGIADVASAIGMEKHNEDFGQTLGYWGVPSGPYLVLPLFGPSTVRDALARPVDGVGSYYPYIDNAATRNSMYVTEKVSDRAQLLETEKAFDDAALDRYTLMRDGWLARRRNLVYDGNPPEDEGDPYGEDDPYADDPYADEAEETEGGSGPDAGPSDSSASEPSK
ncbi:MAG: MlaA family lipoprotein [Lautropia sp.]|nr:MlaA family lipoprotein [Lautropia sp.]